MFSCRRALSYLFYLKSCSVGFKPFKSSPRTDTAYTLWLESRLADGHKLPGFQRSLTWKNTSLAFSILRECGANLLYDLWACHPIRVILLILLSIIKSLCPAFRGYSQALIIDELQSLFASDVFTWTRLLQLLLSELIRRVLESFLDFLVLSNENVVIGSARYFVERKQLETRVRLDSPTLNDPTTIDLLQEADLFTRSFCGAGFGLISPLDVLQLISLSSELFAHILVIEASLTKHSANLTVFVFSALSVSLPLVLPWLGLFDGAHEDPLYDESIVKAAQEQEKMRSMAYNGMHQQEISLFGLEGWILNNWTRAWKTVANSERVYATPKISLLTLINVPEMMLLMQNVPFLILLQSSSTTLGSLSLYRSSLQCVVFCCRSLLATLRMTFQSIFLMGAFCASVQLKPKLQPRDADIVHFRRVPKGVDIMIRNLSYTYPGCNKAAVNNVNLDLAAGETLAIVGFNGSGKSTLAKILLRILDFDAGHLLVNGVDIRRYHPADYHKHLSAVFQDFSKYNLTVHENVGIGNVGKMGSREAVEHAVRLAEASSLVKGLPYGLDTRLESPGFESVSYSNNCSHGLSGGEWQRVAIARAFIRAREPEIDLLVFDEPTSSLDSCAQNRIFDTIHSISHSLSGKRRKSVIFITHRLSTARRADKIAMMQNGTVTECGTHQELLKRGGAYAALYKQSI